MADIIKALNATPLPTLFLLVGIVMLSVGFGLKIRAVVDVDRMDRTYAKLIGAVFLLFGLVPYLSGLMPTVPYQPGHDADPFLVYYLVSVPIVVALYWVVLMSTKGEMQARAAKQFFMMIGGLITVVVLWRAMDVFFYMSSPDRNPAAAPIALYETHSYLPYLALLGIAVLASVWATFANTSEPGNSGNRALILGHFVRFCVYLAFCRLAWELVDYIGRANPIGG